MTADAIQICGVHKRFGALEVLRGIDIDIASGQTIAVLGPSGSGKSTLVRCINMLETIHGGEIKVGTTTITPKGIEIDGRVLGSREVASYRTHVGMVFQSFFMDGGKVVEEGTPAEVLDNPKADRTRAFLRRIG